MLTLHIHPAVCAGETPPCDSRALSKPQVSLRPAGGGGRGDVRVCSCPSLASLPPGLQLLGPRGGGQAPWSCCPSPWSGEGTPCWEGTPHWALSSSQPGLGWDFQPESLCFLKPFLSENKGTFGNKTQGAQPQISPEAAQPEPEKADINIPGKATLYGRWRELWFLICPLRR